MTFLSATAILWCLVFGALSFWALFAAATEAVDRWRDTRKAVLLAVLGLAGANAAIGLGFVADALMSAAV